MKLKDEQDCVGCGACIAVCPKRAIRKKKIGFGAWIPEIDYTLCVSCELCYKVCKPAAKSNLSSFPKKAYISYNRDYSVRKLSASGGAFSAIATYVLKHGGRVFGAEIKFEDKKAIVEHKCITEIKELHRILGSKYVQSDCIKAYFEAKEELIKGELVLFSGCPCQIQGLLNYLGDIDKSNLYTIDLICHGSPGLDLFNDYVAFLERKYKGDITNFYFRTKEKEKINYMETITIENGIEGVHSRKWSHGAVVNTKKDDNLMEIKIPMRKSGYYRMFMAEESYREACYQCPYASLDRPADLTVGDYFELKDDYPEFFSSEDPISVDGGISSVIAHTQKGVDLLEKAKEYVWLRNVDPYKVQASHEQLRMAPHYTSKRNNYKEIYKKHGYYGINKYFQFRNIIVSVPKFFLKSIPNKLKKLCLL